MDKTTYYISVETGYIGRDQQAATYEFEIEATDHEIRKLRELFDRTHEKENDTVVPAIAPAIAYHDDPANDAYDRSLMDIYRMLHQLGTTKTKEHIEYMGVL